MAQQQLVDKRDQFVRTLWDRADTLRRGEFDTAARLATIKALVRIAVHEQPLRSATQCRQVKSVGSEMIKVLETASGPTATETGKYASAAVAILAALLETEKTTIPTPMRDVLDAASKLLESNRRFAPLQQLCAAPMSCSAWEQLKILEGALKLVKRRQRSQCEGGCAFELTDEGRAVARRLAKERRGNNEESRGALRAWGGTSDDDVVVLVDDREGGGDRHHLHSIGQLLKDNRAPFETRTLPTGFGDYVIARRRARIDVARGCGNDVAPVLIERKSAVDVAASLKDGRWQRQHDAMRRVAQSSSRAEIVYVIEGDPSKPVWKSTIASGARRRGRTGSVERRGTGIATPSSRRRVDGVEGDAMIQHEHAIKF